jgi:hypothetical protein
VVPAQATPPGMQGQELLHHMFAQWQISFKTSAEHFYNPNVYLDLATKPFNLGILKHMTAPDLSKRAIMQGCARNGATLNLAARKLNQTGYVQRHCGIINTEDKVRKLRNALQLSQSMATILNDRTEAAQKKIEKQLEYHTLATAALIKLQTKNGE